MRDVRGGEELRTLRGRTVMRRTWRGPVQNFGSRPSTATTLHLSLIGSLLLALRLFPLRRRNYVTMSQVAEHKPKKRKHAVAATDTTAGVSEPSSKRSKTEKAKKDKSKSKTKENVSKGKGKEAAAGQFRVVQASLPLSIPPVFATNLRAGAEEMLDSMLMRYVNVFTLSVPRWR